MTGCYEAGKYNVALFHNPATDCRVLVHGDDFLALGDVPALDDLGATLASKYVSKDMGTLGWETGDAATITVLNRSIQVGTDHDGIYLDIVPDVRHQAKILSECGLDGSCKGHTTPRDRLKDVEIMRGATSELLPPKEATAYRSVTMRLAYLAQDRGDVAEAAKYLAQRMKEPRVHDWEQVKRIARYIKIMPVARLRFRQQRWPGKATVFTDSDWGSCPISRKSTSGLVLMHGRHCLRTSSTLQS